MTPDQRSPFLAVEGVSKRFASVQAVDDLSFQIEQGEVFALLGPNGAGKTTLVRMIVGIMRPDSGCIRSAGQAGDDPTLGYLPEERGLYPDQQVLRIIEYFGRLNGMSGSAAHREGLDWLDRLQLADRAGDKLETLSKGNQQKVQFITSVLHRPSLIVLDEPFSGLDPVNQDKFLDLIKDLCRDGATVLLSSHQMNLVEQIAEHILVIDHGRPALHGTMAEIRGRATSREKILCRLEPGADPAAFGGHPSIREVEPLSNGEVAVWLTPDASLGDALTALCSALPVTSVNSARVNLHEIFVQSVGPREGTEA